MYSLCSRFRYLYETFKAMYPDLNMDVDAELERYKVGIIINEKFWLTCKLVYSNEDTTSSLFYIYIYSGLDIGACPIAPGK